MLFYNNAGGVWVQTDFPGSLMSGEGVFTTFSATPGQPLFRLEHHYKRLQENTAFFGFHFPWKTFQDFQHYVEDFVRERVRSTSVIRITLSKNSFPLVQLRSQPASTMSTSLSTRVWDRPFPKYKHCSRIQEMKYLAEAEEEGFDDVLRISTKGYLTETTRCNLFVMLSDKLWVTPSVEKSGCLPGVMREAVLEACGNAHIMVDEGEYDLSILKQAQGVFVTNAVRGVVPVYKIYAMQFNVEQTCTMLRQLHNSEYFMTEEKSPV